MPKAHLVAHIRVHDSEAFEQFKAMTVAAIADTGVRYLPVIPDQTIWKAN